MYVSTTASTRFTSFLAKRDARSFNILRSFSEEGIWELLLVFIHNPLFDIQYSLLNSLRSLPIPCFINTNLTFQYLHQLAAGKLLLDKQQPFRFCFFRQFQGVSQALQPGLV